MSTHVLYCNKHMYEVLQAEERKDTIMNATLVL